MLKCLDLVNPGYAFGADAKAEARPRSKDCQRTAQQSPTNRWWCYVAWLRLPLAYPLQGNRDLAAECDRLIATFKYLEAVMKQEFA